MKMSEVSSDSSKNHDLSTIVLYFSYFVFFLPYLFKLLSFLSPLFITTSLLLLALLTVSPKLLLHPSRNAASDSSDHELELELEELEVFKIVFEAREFEVLEEKSEKCEEEPIDKCVIEIPTDHSDANPSEPLLFEGKEVKKVREESEKVVEQPSTRRSGSNAIHNQIREAKVDTDDGLDSFEESKDEFMTPKAVLGRYPSFDPNLGSFGSMRKEKEWKRTLACKLFEERHNGEGGGGAEGMDMLWETYEAESTKFQLKNCTKKEQKDRSYAYDDDGEDDVGGQLCCLQALKFSAGKMNLGMGRPSLVKFSKALKGMGWLHHASKGSKKVHNR